MPRNIEDFGVNWTVIARNIESSVSIDRSANDIPPACLVSLSLKKHS